MLAGFDQLFGVAQSRCIDEDDVLLFGRGVEEIEEFWRHGADSIIPSYRFRLEDSAAVEMGLRSAGEH